MPSASAALGHSRSDRDLLGGCGAGGSVRYSLIGSPSCDDMLLPPSNSRRFLEERGTGVVQQARSPRLLASRRVSECVRIPDIPLEVKDLQPNNGVQSALLMSISRVKAVWVRVQGDMNENCLSLTIAQLGRPLFGARSFSVTFFFAVMCRAPLPQPYWNLWRFFHST